MKTNIKLLTVIALLASACTTGSMVTTGGYSDDAYYTPGDHPPVIVSTSPYHEQSAKHAATISGMRQEEAGKIVDNYQSDKKPGNSNLSMGDQSATDMNNQADDQAGDLNEVYDEPEELDYTTRIRTFYDPYAYDPYWDTYYSPGFGFGWGLGIGALYSGFGFGFGGLYGGFYDSYYGGFGMYSPYGYGYGGYGGYGLYGYGYGGYGGYGGYHDGGHDYGYDHHRDRYYGRQNSSGRGNSNAIGYNGTGRGVAGSTYSGRNSNGRSVNGSSAIQSRGGSNFINNSGSTNGSTRLSGTRFTVNPNITKSANTRGSGQVGTSNNSQTLTNLRRSQAVGQTARPSAVNGTNNYTPTYSRPRTNIQPSYNSGASRQYARPQGSSGRASVIGNYQSGSSRAPRAVSSGSTRSSGQVSSGSSRSSSSSATYSAPSRSSSSSFSSGGGGGSSSGGGGGGGGRRH
jgi:hypothetical protein